MDPQREILECAGLLAGKSRRKDFLSAASLVFALVVENLRAFGNYFTDRQRALAEDSHGKLATRHKPFQHHLVVVSIGREDRRFEVSGTLHHGQTDRGALLIWLNDQRQTEIANRR